MPLVFRKNQSTPLTNDQVDGNFEFLKEQIDSKYSTSNFTAANISLKLRTTTGNQTSLQLSEANDINSWLLRDLAPSSTLPSATDKSSIVSRNATGNITVNSVIGSLTGNAATASLASEAVKLQTARTINGIAFDGTGNITVSDATKLPLSGGTLTGKLTLLPASFNSASINFGTSSAPPNDADINDGDVWATTSGLFYKISGQTTQIAPIISPTFTGTPRAPGFTAGTSSQIATLSHLSNTETTLTTAMNLKANLNSPQFTGNVTAPTQATNSAPTTAVATTAYATNVVNAKAAEITTQYQSYTTDAISNYQVTVNNLLALKANLSSPNFTGTPTAPTPASSDNSTRVANTAFITSAISTLKAAVDGSIAALNSAIINTRPVPAGAIFYMATSVVPNGYLECDGSWVPKAQYEDLWQALGFPVLGTGVNAMKFQLPDLRGEFVRGWDHGRGVDSGRTLLSSQRGSQIIADDGNELDTISQQTNSEYHSRGSNYQSPSATWDSYDGLGNIAHVTSGARNLNNYYGVPIDSGYFWHARPRNIALMPVIKY